MELYTDGSLGSRALAREGFPESIMFKRQNHIEIHKQDSVK